MLNAETLQTPKLGDSFVPMLQLLVVPNKPYMHATMLLNREVDHCHFSLPRLHPINFFLLLKGMTEHPLVSRQVNPSDSSLSKLHPDFDYYEMCHTTPAGDAEVFRRHI
jgi:hypothetical protein